MDVSLVKPGGRQRHSDCYDHICEIVQVFGPEGLLLRPATERLVEIQRRRQATIFQNMEKLLEFEAQ